MLASTQACEAAEEECEAVLEREQSGTLPSTGRPPSVGPHSGSRSAWTVPWAFRRMQSGYLSSPRKQEKEKHSLRQFLVTQPHCQTRSAACSGRLPCKDSDVLQACS